MAGAGDRFANVLGPLIQLFGWRHEHDPATGNVTIDSPDGSVFVDFHPLHPLGCWVTVAHHEPYWEAAFSRQAPLEAVAAVTQALPQLLDDTRHSDRIPITDMSLDQLAELHGWAAKDKGVLTSPDHYCRLEHTRGEEIGWQGRRHPRRGRRRSAGLRRRPGGRRRRAGAWPARAVGPLAAVDRRAGPRAHHGN